MNALKPEMHDQYADLLQSMANDCRDDAEVRAQFDADPRAVLAGRGLPFPESTDVRVVRNTDEVFHLTMPPDPNAALSDARLEGVTGGYKRQGCASTASTLPSCLGCYSSATN